MTERDERRARLAGVLGYPGMIKDVAAELEASGRDRESLALARSLIGQHLSDNGPCDDAPDMYGDDYERCDESCTYCAMCVSEFGRRQ